MMKKLIAVFVVVSTLLLSCFPVLAGDIPEALSYEDDAKVFVGTLLSCFDSPIGTKDVTVLPTVKIKGDVELGVDDTFEGCYFPNQEPEIGAEYFFGWLSNTEVYAYEIKSRTDNKITIHITDEFAERIQNYLDEGMYQQAEIERVNVGGKITFTELLGTDSAYVKSVTFSLNGTNYEVDAEAFYQFADSAVITDVKNGVLNRFGADDWEKDILYITLNLKENANGGGFAMVTKYGEVDCYTLTMSRLPECDYEMTEEDLAKLYAFLPEDVQRALYAQDTRQVAESSSDIVIWVGVIAGVVFACAAGVVLYRKKRK